MADRRRSLVLAAAVVIGSTLLSSPGDVLAADPVLVGAGDIASCSSNHDAATARLVERIAGTVATLGDNVYPTGTARQFRTCYGPTWGRLRARTRPAIGNHDIASGSSSGYFGYFGARAGRRPGWYSYDLGTWHIIVLDSNCAQAGGCGATSKQATWLRADLAKHPDANVLAYWHRPRFSSGQHGSSRVTAAFWDILYAAGADIILDGHDHDYERFAPQDPSGVADSAHGIREFVVGTGGATLRGRGTRRAANSRVFRSAYGVLKLTLHPHSYDWVFIPVAGGHFTDSGSGLTHGPPG